MLGGQRAFFQAFHQVRVVADGVHLHRIRKQTLLDMLFGIGFDEIRQRPVVRQGESVEDVISRVIEPQGDGFRHTFSFIQNASLIF